MFLVVGGVPIGQSFISLKICGYALTLVGACKIVDQNYKACGGLYTIIDTTTFKEVQYIDQSPSTQRMNAQDQTSVNEIINDHTCISCGNTRCSKSEKVCWRCGSLI